MAVAAVTGVGLSAVLPFSSTMFWGMLNTLQLILHIPLFSIAFPSHVAMMFSQLIQMANFEIFPMEDIIMKLLPWFEQTPAFTEKFDYLEYGCCDMTINVGNCVLIWMILCTTILLVFAFGILKKRCPRTKKYYEKFKNELFFNAFLRTIVETYLLVCIATLTSLVAGQDHPLEKFLKNLFFIFIIVVPIMCVYFGMRINKMKEKHRAMIESLFDSLNTETFWARQFSTIFMVRRLAFTLVAIYVVDHGAFQVQFYLLFSILHLMFIILVWPYEN